MGHSIGDGIIVAALAAAFIGYYYLKYLEKQRRLDIVHQERLVAMEKGIPLPELPLDPSPYDKRPDPQMPLLMGTVFLSLGGGAMLAFSLITTGQQTYWPLPLPLAMVGLGLMLYYFLAGNRDR